MPPPAPASPSPALSPGGAAAPAPRRRRLPPAVAQPGMPRRLPAPAGAGMGSGAPMMLPPLDGATGGRCASPGGPTMPAGTIGAGASAILSGTAVECGRGATLIPASWWLRADGGGSERRESANAAAAKELAWKLQYAAESVNYIGIDWAVSSFPVTERNRNGHHVQRRRELHPGRCSCSALGSSPGHRSIGRRHFRQLWFGWHDPARVLVEYAHIRSEMAGDLLPPRPPAR